MNFRFGVLSILVTVISSPGPVKAQATSQESLNGRLITNIEFPRDQPLDIQELKSILDSQDIRLRTPLREASVSTAIQKLFSTGRFTDIQVKGEATPDGVVLQFVTTNAWFVGNVSIEGKTSDPPNPGQLVNASRLQLGTRFDPTLLEPAEVSMRRLLTANGFYSAIITHRLDYTAHAQQVNIIFSVDLGRRANYTAPEILGTDLVLLQRKIIKATSWHKFLVPGWRGVTQKRTNQGAQNVRLRYDKAGRLLATVELSRLEYEELNNKPVVRPTLTIEAGPKLEIKAVGAKISKSKLRNNVPVYEEHSVDHDLLQEGANNLKDELQASGYFDAAVEYKESRTISNTEEIEYVITLGERHRLAALSITGNRYFTVKTLRERMFLEIKSLQFRRGRFSNAFLRRDKESISNLYRSNGFRDISVTSEISDNYKGKSGDLAVAIKVDEGKQWIVSSLEVAGHEKLDLHQIISTLNSSQDQPFSEFNIAADREQILNYYFENGFPNAQFSWTSTPGTKPNLVNLTYKIDEGNQQFVREVIYAGQRTTKEKLINRQITMKPGDPLSPVQMSEIQRKLYDLGIFAKVDTAVQNPDGISDRKYALFDVEEASRWTVTGGLGAEIARIGGSTAANDLSNPGGATGFSPRVELDLTRINFLGSGQTLSLRTRYSSFDKLAQLSYLIPRVFDNRKLDLTITTLYDDSYDVRTFAAKREEASVQLTDHISKPTTIFFRLGYRNVGVSNLKIDPLLIPTLAQSTRTGIVSMNIVNDRRDDPTDAHRGVYSTLDLGLAGHFLGGKNDFIRAVGRNSTYTRIGEKLILARQTSIGVLPIYGKAAVINPLDPDPIPLAERLFGGGTDSMRGFPQNQAGSRDQQTGFPLGGSMLFFNNTELRFPLVGDNIGGVLFEDFGNIFDRPGDLTFNVHQPHPDNPTDFNYMVHAIGFGIRYKTPIGPIRLDLAYSLNPPKYYGYSGSFQDLVNCTATGDCVRGLQTISHVQFFFSIGQTF